MFNEETKHPARLRAVLLWITPVAVVVAIVACSGAFSFVKAQNSSTPQVQTVSIPVEGMSCVSCAARVKRTLKGIEGVQQVEVSLERREAVVRFSPAKVTPERLESAINGLGYKAGKSRVAESK